MHVLEAKARGAAAVELAPPVIGDAAPRNWVDRYAPDSLKPWLRLIRADRPIGVWLLLWPCLWSTALAAGAAHHLPDPYLMLLFAIGAFAMRSAGCIYNDILDRDIDAKVARTAGRPLASGQISVRSGAILICLLCLVGLGVLLQFDPFAIALGFASVGIVLIYPLMKRVTFWPQAVLGLAFSWGALLGWAATFGSLSLAPVALYAGCIAWTIGYDTIYAHQDKEDDEIVGLKSTALLFGDTTKSWLTLFYAVAILGIALSGWLAGAGSLFFAGVAIAGLQLAWQVATLDIHDGGNCLNRFRSNHLFGALVFAAFMADALARSMN